jgi:hypothetical protein
VKKKPETPQQRPPATPEEIAQLQRDNQRLALEAQIREREWEMQFRLLTSQNMMRMMAPPVYVTGIIEETYDKEGKVISRKIYPPWEVKKSQNEHL